MKTKWSPFQPFNVKTSAAGDKFTVRAKNRPETAVHFNQHGQVIECATGRLLDWQPEEQAETEKSAKPEAPAAVEADPAS